ncbi:unnamed protein product [Thlaspi arvense]|uniref:Uncharacterized protein n=1 Tax=Thlaspi arvense TaxID=13288 RepID=A0AAU9RGE9_THLAR|nr:unnamed protein product [Thlaspi arvense]
MCPTPHPHISNLLSVTASNKHLNPDPFPEQEDVFLLIHILECGILVGVHPNRVEGDVENPTSVPPHSWSSRLVSVTWQPLNFTIWEVIGWLVPLVKHLKDKKLKHHQALQVVKLLCKQLERLPDPKDASSHTIDAVIEAAIQVRNRCENVFNLAYQMSKIRLAMMDVYVDNGNTILHLAGQLAPRYKLSLVSGAALQMQYELQWFKEVEKFMTPRMKNSTNIDNKTPQEVFTEAHKDLVNDGEKWMKDTANSCTIAAALIVTIGKAWILIGVAALASLPITSFVFLQFPLLVDVISSTYGPGVFGKKSDRAFR